MTATSLRMRQLSGANLYLNIHQALGVKFRPLGGHRWPRLRCPTRLGEIPPYSQAGVTKISTVGPDIAPERPLSPQCRSEGQLVIVTVS